MGGFGLQDAAKDGNDILENFLTLLQ